MSEYCIETEDLSFSYDGITPTLSGISFRAEKNEAIGLIGANGAGKSTLLKILVGLTLGYSGSVQIMGIPVEKKTLSQVRKHIGYVFQDSDNQLFMTTVEEDIAFAPRNYGLPEKEVKKRTDQALTMTGIENLRAKQIYKLSGGEKKLAAIATILSMTPDIILMDEPSAALDPRNRRNLIRLINQLDQLKIIACHDLDFILDTCPRTILVGKGRIIRDGKTEEILRDKELLEENGLELPLSFSL